MTKNKYSNFKAFVKTIFSETISYSTVRSATIESKTVAIVYRLAQLGILTYIIGYDIFWNKGYQTFDTVTSTISTKVKGLGFIRFDSNNNTNQKYTLDLNDYFQFISKFNKNADFGRVNDVRIFDTSDYVIPPNEYNSLFIMTNFIETIQTPGLCDESVRSKYGRCKKHSDCITAQNTNMNSWNGIPTGQCINSTEQSGVRVCEIAAWCPVERDYINPEQNLIRNIYNFTILVKNDVEFKRFHKKERNIHPNVDKTYLANCRYDPILDPLCPIYVVGDILKTCETNETERELMLKKGGIIEIGFQWNCNYDLLFKKPCIPTVNFRRFDTPFKDGHASSGFNFRFSNKYMINNSEYRNLYKAFGLRFIISVTGQAGRFSILPLMITIGAGFGLMSISVLIADCVMLNFTHKKKLFQKLKELDANEAIIINTNIIKKSEI